MIGASVPALAFELLSELREGREPRLLELADPALREMVDRHRIDEMQLLPPRALPRHEVGLLQDRQMLRDRLARHVQALTELTQRLTVLGTQTVEQLPSARIRQGPEDQIHQ